MPGVAGDLDKIIACALRGFRIVLISTKKMRSGEEFALEAVTPGVIRTHDVAAVGSRLFNQDRTAVDTDVVEGADDAVGLFGQQQRLAGNFDRTNRSRLGQKMRKLSKDPVALKDAISFCCKEVGIHISDIRKGGSFCGGRTEALPQFLVKPLIVTHRLILASELSWDVRAPSSNCPSNLPDRPGRLKALQDGFFHGSRCQRIANGLDHKRRIPTV